MPTLHYLPPKDQDRVAWLNNFAAKLPAYKTTFGLSDADLAGVAADAVMWEWMVGWCEAMRTRAQNITAFKNQLRDGPEGAVALPPGAPDFRAAPPSVAPDVFGRIGRLVQTIKNHRAYTEASGRDLVIVSTATAEDPSVAKPLLGLSLADAGHVRVGWTKRGMDALRIEVDRGKGWEFLAIDTMPDYTDTAPLPPPGQSAVWKYRAIYLLDDQPVGQWSDPVSMAVMGS
jgi:hypothetical protein